MLNFGMSFHILYRAQVAIFCIGNELPYFVYDMSCHCIDIGNDVPFFTTIVYDWKFVYMNISFFTSLY